MDMDDVAIPHDARISEIFYFFEALTTLASGRTVGRKIGVVQEVMLRWYLEAEPELRRRMFLERKLVGASGAGHKVEFSWYAIECSSGLRAGAEIPDTHGLEIGAIDSSAERVRITGPWGGAGVWVRLGEPTIRSGPLRIHLDDYELDIRVLDIEADSVRLDVVDFRQLLASLESKRVGAQRFSASDKLGAGIQTIEKAKQASLVAIDLDIRHNGTVKPLQDPAASKRALSLVALGNGVHWTDKDKAVLGTYVDYTFLVKDAGIIRYADFVRDFMADGDDFMAFFKDYFVGMTKQEPDGFPVGDDDFEIVAPAEETRPLAEIMVDHVTRQNPTPT